jgi:hypothetical protein
MAAVVGAVDEVVDDVSVAVDVDLVAAPPPPACRANA